MVLWLNMANYDSLEYHKREYFIIFWQRSAKEGWI